MPAINGPSRTWFYNEFKMYDRRLRALETQQNWGITDNNLKLRIRGGLQPDATFGIWMLDPTTGNPVMKLTGTMLELLSAAGAKLIELTDGGLALYNATGHLLIDLTDTGLAVYSAAGKLLVDLTDTGLAVYNATGVEQVQLGAIGSGDYGLTVRNPAGVMQQVAGRAIDTATGPLTYSSTTWGALSGGPSVSVTAGPSGTLDVSLGAIIKPGSHSAGESAYLAVSLTGSGPYTPQLQCSVNATSNQEMTCFGEVAWTGLTAGKTYSIGVMAWASTSGVAATYRQVTLKAAPA